MRFHKWATIAAVLALMVGCIAIPKSRTYYEPNSADGKLIQSASCGWNTTALDAIERDVDGITLSVYPKYDNEHPFRVYVLLGRTSKMVGIDPDKLEVRFSDGAASVRPSTSSVEDAGPYAFKSINYVFSSSLEASEIAITFLPGFIRLDGKDNETIQFRFRRVTKFDVYYGSINC